MARYFRELARQRAAKATRSGFPVLDPVALWKAQDEVERSGRAAIPAADAFAQLLGEAGE
jgi:hypothetical protein